jgi:hypothetical protein
MAHDINEPNDQLVLVVGYSSGGKSASLRNLTNQERWLYLNTEAGKRLPFKNSFKSYRITDPYQVHEAFDYGTDNPEVDGIVVDSLTFLMDMFESQYVINSANTMKGWADFAQFYKVLMQQKVTLFNKPAIFTAHVLDTLDERNMEMKTSVPVKGSLKNNGIEAYFSTVVAAKRVAIKELEKYGSKLLVISDEEKELGYKHVFQTRPTKTTTGERLRSPMEMFTKEQTYMDNDVQVLLNHLHEFYHG